MLFLWAQFDSIKLIVCLKPKAYHNVSQEKAENSDIWWAGTREGLTFARKLLIYSSYYNSW